MLNNSLINKYQLFPPVWYPLHLKVCSNLSLFQQFISELLIRTDLAVTVLKPPPAGLQGRLMLVLPHQLEYQEIVQK